jgi:phosphomannomutase
MKQLFGTSGIRGHGENYFTDQLCFDIGLAFDQFLNTHGQSGPIAIGMDPRGSSPRIKHFVSLGLQEAGRSIYDQGVTPSPCMCHVLTDIPDAGSIMVTGSHIAPELNGVKFFFNREEIQKTHEEEITARYYKIKNKSKVLSKSVSSTNSNRANDLYQNLLVNLAHSQFPGMVIVVDCGNGAQSNIMPEVLERLECRVIRQNCDIQGEFIARDTEADGAVSRLQERVIREKADLGIAFDADGDRAVFVDHTGRFVPGDYTGALLAKASVSSDIVTPISTSQVIDMIGKKVHRTRVGSPVVISKMKEINSQFGYEANGGCISREVMMTRDGGGTSIKILNLITKTGKNLAQLYDELPKFYQFRVKVDCPTELNQTIIKKAKEIFRGDFDETDGLKIWRNNKEWLLFRPSGNAPEFRVFTESPDPTAANELGERALSFVRKTIEDSS